MNSESKEQQLVAIREKRANWMAIIKQWNDLTPFAPIPAFTKEYSEKMIKKLDAEERSIS